MNKKFWLLASIFTVLLASCGSSGDNQKSLSEQALGDMESYENDDVNAIEQARPTIMIIPGYEENTTKII